MNTNNSITRMLAALTVLVTLTGCLSMHKGHDAAACQDPTHDHYVAPAPTPAPKPAAKPAPAPAPAPAGMVSATLYEPTGDASTSALMLTKSVPGQVNVGESFDVVYTIKNLTNMSLDNVVVTDQLPAGFKVSGTNPANAMGANGAMMIGTLGPGESKTIKITGSATQAGQLMSCADVTYDTSICVATVVVQPALQLTATGPAEVILCDKIPVCYTVSNKGTGPARDVMLTAAYPAGLRDETGATSLSRDIGTLAAGQSKQVCVNLTASKTGVYSNGGTAKASSNLSATSNTVSTTVRQPVLTIAMNCTGNSYLGRNARYEIKVGNTGDAAAAGASLVATVPANMTFASATNGGVHSAGRVTWKLGDLAAGGASTVSFVATATTKGTGRSTATVDGACATQVSAQCETEVTGVAAILLEVIDEDDPVLVGENVTYEIVVTNQGSAIDTNIRITCAIPQGADFVSATGATTGTRSGNTISFASLPSLAPQAKATFRVTLKAGQEANVRFGVTMMSDELGSTPVQETESTTFYQ